MANLGNIEVRTTEYRPCYVTDAVAYSCGVPVRRHERKALFHRYADKLVAVVKMKGGYIYPKFMLDEAKLDYECRGILPHGFDVERVYSTVAIVEFEDGTVGEVDPASVRFVPGLMNEFDFMEAVMNETRNDADS